MLKGKISILLLLLVLVFSVSVIGEAKTTVQVVSWWDFTNSEPLIELKDKFEDMNPDLEMEFMQIGGDVYADKILTMIAGGADLPDVMMLAMDKVPVFASKGAIMNLDKHINQDQEFKGTLDNLYPAVSDALQFNGNYYAMPRDVTTKVMYLNKKMFDEAGMDIPDEDWTWNDFAEIAKKLSDDNNDDGNNDQWGFYFPKWNDGFNHWLNQNGGGFVTNDGKSLLGKDETIEALEFLQGLINKGYIPSDTQAKQYGNTLEASFIAGKVAMVEGGLSVTVALENNNVDYVIRPLPKGKRRMTTAFVNAWAIPRGVKDPELSMRVLKFFASEEAQEIVLNTGMGLPANKNVNTDSFLGKRSDNKYLIDSIEYSEPFPTPLKGIDFFKLVEKEFSLMWLGDRTVEDAVNNVEMQAERILSGIR